jgi:hypothetical protein
MHVGSDIDLTAVLRDRPKSPVLVRRLAAKPVDRTGGRPDLRYDTFCPPALSSALTGILAARNSATGGKI